MRKIVALMCIVLLVSAACQTRTAPATEPSIEENEEPTATPMPPTATPMPPTATPRPTLEPLPEGMIGRVLLVFGSNFQDRYYLRPRTVFLSANYQVMVASLTLDTFRSANNMEVRADMVLEDVEVSDYDAILFLGDLDLYIGNGRPETDRIVQEANEQGIVLGGICGGVQVLGFGGILEGVEVTASEGVCRSVQGAYGAVCTNELLLQISDLIVTGSPDGSGEVAEAIVTILQE